MVIKCIKTNTKFLDWPSESTPINCFLKVGTLYKVYGVIFQKDYRIYAICNNEENTFPRLWPEDMFEVIDNKLSPYFHLGHMTTFEGRRPFLSFKEWAEDDSFYGKMIDDKSAEEIFRDYRKKIDNETIVP